MKYNALGSSELMVSELCLGTMTYGEQNTEEEAFAQMDYAYHQGINFFDTAELYPVPPRAQTYGQTERIIGNWFTARKLRPHIILATKIAGPSAVGGHIRDGKTRFNAVTIAEAIDHSLTRLQTDYIDLLQLHWPERPTNFFSELGYQRKMIDHTPSDLTPFVETLEALHQEIKRGRIRHIGLSNETPWGVMQFLHLAKLHGLACFVSIQNPYCLLNRTFEIGLAEVSHHKNIGLLAYSPLGFGVLSGKYLHGKKPDNARITRFPRFSRYTNTQAVWATEQYALIAQQYNISLAQLSLAFVRQQFFTCSTIIGSTSLSQLEENISSCTTHLSDEILAAIDAVHKQQPNPAP